MIHLTRALIRRWLDALLHVHDTPERTAAAFAMGVFMGFSPFLGLHTIMAIVLAFVFGLNRVATLLGVYSNLPWIIGGYYAFTTWIGALITRVKLPADFEVRLFDLFDHSVRSRYFWDQLGDLLRPLLVPFVVGSLLGCSVLAMAAYPLALAFVRNRRKHPLLKHK
jgi:uncharacterized protein (DUF2062 family)